MMFCKWLNSHRIFKRQAKALVRLRICAGWSEAMLVTHTTLLEISCHGPHEKWWWYFSYRWLAKSQARLCIHIVLQELSLWLAKSQARLCKKNVSLGWWNIFFTELVLIANTCNDCHHLINIVYYRNDFTKNQAFVFFFIRYKIQHA